MSHKQIKWLILLIPTIVIGLWEYVRHHYLLMYISMETGNWLAPVIVLIVTLLLLTRLFSIMEHMQEDLTRTKSSQFALQERENMARELHDGIAQSLFLLSVKVEQLEKSATPQSYEGLKKIIHDVNTYVRQSISNLRYPANPSEIPWLEALRQLSLEVSEGTELDVQLDWEIPAEKLSSKDKVQLFAIIREALWNVRKHAGASQTTIEGKETKVGWQCSIIDDGSGFQTDLVVQSNTYGLTIMKERAETMGWSFNLRRISDKTIVEVAKETI